MPQHHVTAPWRHAAALAVTLSLFAACGDDAGDRDAARSEPVKGGELTIATQSAITSLAPGFAADPGDVLIALGIFDPLTTYVDGEVVPYLAQTLEASADLSTYVLELREGVTFHDGTPLDADSVVKHFDRLKDPATGCPCQAEVSLIESMETPDGPTGLTVTFHLAAPSVGLPDLFATSSGYIESPTAVASLGAAFADRPVGTGPFVLTELVPDERAVLTAHPDYWGHDDRGVQLPYLETLTVVPIADSARRLAALTAGEIDLFQTADSGAIAQAEDAGLQAQELTGSGSTSLVLNSAKPPFNDVRARQAVAYAIDRQLIDDRLYSGVRTPSYSPLATASPYYNPDAGTPHHDPKRATELVDDLGGLTFTITCTPTPEAEGVAQLMQQMGDAVGMDITLETQDPAMYDARISSGAGDFQAACHRNAPVVDPDDLRSVLTTDGPGNVGAYSNLEVDQLFARASASDDVELRRRLYFRIQAIIGDEVPSVTTLYDLFGNVYDADRVGPPPPGEANVLGAIKPGLLHAMPRRGTGGR